MSASSRRPVLAALLLLAAPACSSGTTTDTLVVHATLMEVSPESFLGNVPCRAIPGGMQAYLPLLLDVTPTALGGPATNLTTQPTTLVSCLRSTVFSKVELGQGQPPADLIVGHRYAAEVRGYESPDANPADFRWSTTCGLAPPPLTDAGTSDAGTGDAGADDAGADGGVAVPGVAAWASLTRRIEPCAPLVDSRPSTITAVSVDLDSVVGGSLLGTLQCGDTPGTEVAEFVAAVVDPPPAGPIVSEATPCGDPALLDLTPGIPVRISITAYDAPHTSSWHSDCFATPIQGVTLPASCDPLSPISPE